MRMYEVGGYLAQRRKHEAPLVKARVRDSQDRSAKPDSPILEKRACIPAAKQYINVNHTRPVHHCADAPHLALDSLQGFKQRKYLPVEITGG